jgi:glycosyltransferase involved in cell wall biosynthesis
VEWAGALPRERWLETVARARVFVNASRYEDWGMAQMEALSAGTPLVAVASPGPNEALGIARQLAPQLVAEERTVASLARALRAGLALDRSERAAYAGEARRLLAPYRREAVARTVGAEVLPALLSPA